MNNLIEKIETVLKLLSEIKEEILLNETSPENGALKEAPSLDLKETQSADKALRQYERLIGLITPAVIEGIDFVIGEGMEPELVIRIIEYACEQGVRRWQYINKILVECLKENILTLDTYNRHQAERAERNVKNNIPVRRTSRSKLNNYHDSKRDYSKIQEEILNEMLEE